MISNGFQNDLAYLGQIGNPSLSEFPVIYALINKQSRLLFSYRRWIRIGNFDSFGFFASSLDDHNGLSRSTLVLKIDFQILKRIE